MGSEMCIRDRNGPVHLGCARDHVLDVVSVARAVDVCVVPVLSLVLDVRRVDGDACLLYTSDAADERSSVDLGGRRIIKKKKE